MKLKDRKGKGNKSAPKRQMLCDFSIYDVPRVVRFIEIKKKDGGCPGLGDQENRALLSITYRLSTYKKKDSRRCATVMAVPK